MFEPAGPTGPIARDVAAEERQPLLRDTLSSKTATHVVAEREQWIKPRYFLLVEIGIFCNVFLAGFDGTVTASTYTGISSQLKHSNLASWITTSYLLTSTATLPLYGRFSDIFGRRACLLAATIIFGLGCLGCALSPDMITLILMRAIAGFGGGGLMTMTTIVNSDLVPGKQRGMYQAIQNILHGAGAIAGATLGGFMADHVGWRMCFLAQLPFCVASLFLSGMFLSETRPKTVASTQERPLLERLDLIGAGLLSTGLVFQLTAMSLGSDTSWARPAVVITFAASVITVAFFCLQESRCKGIPILPLRMLVGMPKVAMLLANITIGVIAYGMLFLMPLFFQTVFLDSASVSGLRLVPSSLATPVGGLTTGLLMRRDIDLTLLTRLGLFSCILGNSAVLCLGEHDPGWIYSTALVFGNFGQGVVYQALLFASIKAALAEDSAVATSLAYMCRSLGTVWGVAAVSTLVQSLLPARLEIALAHLPGGRKALEELRVSTSALQQLRPELRIPAQHAYYETCQSAFCFVVAITIFATFCAFLIPVRHRSKA